MLDAYERLGGMMLTEELILLGLRSDVHASGDQLADIALIPELTGCCSSIPNVYLCDSGAHPGPGVSMGSGRNAYRVIAGDLGFATPEQAS